jgi:hypothetical protein
LDASVNDIEIEQHRKATGAHLEVYGDQGWFLWFRGEPEFGRTPQLITRQAVGDAILDDFNDEQAIAYIESRMLAAGYEVRRSDRNGSTVVAWEIRLAETRTRSKEGRGSVQK